MQRLIRKSIITAVAAIASAALASAAQAGVTVSQLVDGPTFEGTPTINTAGTLSSSINTSFTTSQTISAGATNRVGQSFITGASGFQLDKIEAYVAGGANTGLGIHLYSGVSGGAEADGFVNPNNPTPNDLLGGGAGLTFSFDGTPTQSYLVLDLTGSDEVMLAPNTRYYIEFSGGSVAFFSRRASSSPYNGGNVYAGSDPTTFRSNVSGNGVRDAAFAVYALAPEPSSLALLGLGGLAVLRRRRHA